ncbi:MAG: indolepyruvate ferredoxin oxidoreductase subunit alpha [Candidatus Geothermincolales bacterium]
MKRKVLLSGNEAVALGAYQAGVSVAAAYPGTPSTQILEELSKFPEVYCEWSSNEKVALEVAIGAALGGKRSLAAMKHVGLNVAADSWMTLTYIGVNAGLVLAVADDPGMHSSQNEQDTRYYALLAKAPMLEPSDSQEALDLVKEAFRISERFDLPVLLRLETRISHSRTVVEVEDGPREEVDYPYRKDAVKRVMIPAHARMRHPVLLEKLEELKRFGEVFPYNRVEMGDPRVGIVTSGVCYQYVREAFPNASVLKLTMTYPLPERMVREFCSHFHRVYVVEELEPFLETALKSMGIDAVGKARIPRVGELNPDIVAEAFRELVELDGGTPPRSWPAADVGRKSDLPARPPVMCPGCPHRGLFYALRRMRATVSGDIGCYTLSVLPPLQGIDCQVCMGAGIGMALGLERAFSQSNLNAERAGKVVGALGDSTFIHAGIPALVDMVYNKTPVTVIILDNRTTAMTGFQEHPGTGRTIRGEETHALDLEALCRAVGVKRVRVVDPWDLEGTERALREELEAGEPSVVISRRPCSLKERPDKHVVYRVDRDGCDACWRCLRLGCPALSRREEKAWIDGDLCRGCSMCAQLCAKGAIEEVGDA